VQGACHTEQLVNRFWLTFLGGWLAATHALQAGSCCLLLVVLGQCSSLEGGRKGRHREKGGCRTNGRCTHCTKCIPTKLAGPAATLPPLPWSAAGGEAQECAVLALRAMGRSPYTPTVERWLKLVSSLCCCCCCCCAGNLPVAWLLPVPDQVPLTASLSGH
jgi:hypothetical protein